MPCLHVGVVRSGDYRDAEYHHVNICGSFEQQTRRLLQSAANEMVARWATMAVGVDTADVTLVYGTAGRAAVTASYRDGREAHRLCPLTPEWAAGNASQRSWQLIRTMKREMQAAIEVMQHIPRMEIEATNPHTVETMQLIEHILIMWQTTGKLPVLVMPLTPRPTGAACLTDTLAELLATRMLKC